MAGSPVADAFKAVDLIVAEAIERIDELSDFDADFASQLASRLGKFGARTLFTDKQREVIGRLAKKLGMEAPEW